MLPVHVGIIARLTQSTSGVEETVGQCLVDEVGRTSSREEVEEHACLAVSADAVEVRKFNSLTWERRSPHSRNLRSIVVVGVVIAVVVFVVVVVEAPDQPSGCRRSEGI
jgi:hypothetical protein